MQLNFLESAPQLALSDGFPERMVLLDCETTGGRAGVHRIIEIGLIVVEKGQVIETWQTFLNPDCELPMFIQNLTGIRPRQLERAPRFDEIAETMLAKLQGRTLVAHNARFDYGFLKNEFARLGITYTTKPLCSVKFSRSMYPQFRRHGLDQIVRRFNFSIENRHRALDDALMIHQFFLRSSALFTDSDIRAVCDQLMKTTTLPPLLDPKEVDRLPRGPGVYSFYDAKGALLYVGKSVNVRSRVLSHFSQDHKQHKSAKMSGLIAHVDCVETPTDFGAQLLESQKIKAQNPKFNARLRKVKEVVQVRLIKNSSGYLVPRLNTTQIDQTLTQSMEHYGLFRSRRHAVKRVTKLADQFFLCRRLLGIEDDNPNKTVCCRLNPSTKDGQPCCNKPPPEHYNPRLRSALTAVQKRPWPFSGPVMVIETGKSDKKNEVDNVALHLLDQWVYIAKLTSIDDVYDFGMALARDKRTPSRLSQRSDPLDEPPEFELDTYFILQRFLPDPERRNLAGLKIVPLLYVNNDTGVV